MEACRVSGKEEINKKLKEERNNLRREEGLLEGRDLKYLKFFHYFLLIF